MKRNRPKTKLTNVPAFFGLRERNPGVWTGRAWNISFFYFYACLCHIELHFCVRNQGNYERWKEVLFKNDRLPPLWTMCIHVIKCVDASLSHLNQGFGV